MAPKIELFKMKGYKRHPTERGFNFNLSIFVWSISAIDYLLHVTSENNSTLKSLKNGSGVFYSN